MENFFIYCFQALTEMHLRVQRNDLLRNTVFGVFLQHFMILSQLYSILVSFFEFFSKTALNVTTTTLKQMFFSRKPTQLPNILKFRANMFGCFVRFFSRTVKTAFYLSKLTLGVKKFFEKKLFHFFSGLCLENLKILSKSLKSLCQR